MIGMREESANLRRAEEDRELTLALLPDADAVLPSSVANAIAAPRKIVSDLTRRAMRKSGETPAALKVAWSMQNCSASSSSTSAVMPRDDESVHSFESTQSDTEVSVEYEDEEEQEDDYEVEDYSSDCSD